MTDSDRAAFEIYIKDAFGLDTLERIADAPNSYYRDSAVQRAWVVWQSACDARTPGYAAGVEAALAIIRKREALDATQHDMLVALGMEISALAPAVPEEQIVERVARAMRAHEWSAEAWDHHTVDDSDREYWRRAATVAIAALRGE